jgi:hypothetical protein
VVRGEEAVPRTAPVAMMVVLILFGDSLVHGLLSPLGSA